MTERLTTLAAVKDWLNILTDTSDARLVQLIDAVSQYVLNYTRIDSFKRATYTQNFRGNGKSSVLLRNWPVLGIDAVATGGTSIVASTFNNYMPSSGYSVSDPRTGMQSLDLYGYSFINGAPSTVVYQAGWETEQSGTIPATPYEVTLQNVWLSDLGVTLDGVAAVLVEGAPGPGEYSISEWGLYTFNAADAGKAYGIAYSYVPPVVTNAAMELVGEWAKHKDRIGILSKTLGGQETITFTTQEMTRSVRMMLQPFVNVVPL